MSRRGDYWLSPCSVEITLWAIAHRTPITLDDIITRWNVHKSSAHRWIHVLNDARDQVARTLRRPTQVNGCFRVPVQPEVRAP